MFDLLAVVVVFVFFGVCVFFLEVQVFVVCGQMNTKAPILKARPDVDIDDEHDDVDDDDDDDGADDDNDDDDPLLFRCARMTTTLTHS